MTVFLVAALTADGFIAKDPRHRTDWTCKEDKEFFHERTKRAGVVIMGRNTYDTIGTPLPGRRNIVYTRRELDGVQTTKEEPATLLDRLEAEGFSEAAVIGGAQIYTMFLKAGLVHTLYLTTEPILFGRGMPLAAEPLDLNLKLVEQTKLNEDSILTEWRVLYE